MHSTPTPRADELHALLLADLALLEGHAAARHVAAALLKVWDRRDRSGAGLVEELARVAGITEAELGGLRQQADRLVQAAEGDARRALTQHGGLAREVYTAVARESAGASRQLTALGAGIRVPLRELPKDRYVDYMPVGMGGMGIVYWALDTELGREVAFKIVRPPSPEGRGGVTPPAPVRMRAPEGSSETARAFDELKARFLQEAWVTSGMEHPGIVPVYELGRTQGGVPYYTMRFVGGKRTLETALDDVRHRSCEARLALLEPLLRVCDAISYAHSRGVVHRDLKPGNVALGDFGEAVVLDWGLAKLTGHPDAHAAGWKTRVTTFREETEMATPASALGTPGYMAPEAARSDVARLDELSDVYSLGVMLFEILTGRLPFEFTTPDEYATQVLAHDPPGAGELDPAVPSALAALCARALARDRSQRPQGVTALADGIRSWQERRAQEHEIDVHLDEAGRALSETHDLPAQAVRRQAERAAAACRQVLDVRPGHALAEDLLARARSLGESTLRAEARQAQRRLVRRISIGTLVVALLAAGVVTYALERRRRDAEHAHEVAALHRTRAEEAMGLMTAELREALEPEGRLEILARMGEMARAHFEAIPLEAESTRGFRQRMRALRQLGEVYLAQGNLPRARRVFREAVTAGEAFAARDAPSALARFERDRARVNLARVDHAQGYPRRGRERVQAVVEHMAGPRPQAVGQPAWDEARVHALNALARALRGTSEPRRARASADASLEIVRRMLQDPQVPRAHRRLAVEMALLAALARFRDGDVAGGLTLAERTVADAEGLEAGHPDDVSLRALALRAAYTAAHILRYSNRFERAERVVEDVVPSARALVALRPDNFQWRDLYMRALFLLGDARSGAGYEAWKAADVYAESFELAEALHAHDPSHAGWAAMLVNLCDRRVRAISADPKASPAERLALRRRAATFARRLSALEPENARWRYMLAYTLGNLAVHVEEPEEQVGLTREALAHNRYALKRIATSRDVSDYFAVLCARLAKREATPAARIATARDGFGALLASARRRPDAYWPQFYVGEAVRSLAAALRGGGSEATLEVRRETRAALAHFETLRARGAELDAKIAGELPQWMETVRRVASQSDE